MLINIKTDDGPLFINMDHIDGMYFDTTNGILYLYRKGQSSVPYYRMSESKVNEAIKQLTELVNNEFKINIE